MSKNAVLVRSYSLGKTIFLNFQKKKKKKKIQLLERVRWRELIGNRHLPNKYFISRVIFLSFSNSSSALGNAIHYGNL